MTAESNKSAIHIILICVYIHKSIVFMICHFCSELENISTLFFFFFTNKECLYMKIDTVLSQCYLL